MKAWVFNEEQLDEALDSWGRAELEQGGVMLEVILVFKVVIASFLESPQAAKLRIKELDDAPPEPQR